MEVAHPALRAAAPELAFVVHRGQNLFFVDLIEGIRDELDRLGVVSSLHLDGPPPPKPGLVCVLVPPHEYIALSGGWGEETEPLLARSIVVCAEQPQTTHIDADAPAVARAGAVFDLHPDGVREWRRRGRPDAEVLTVGYTARWDATPLKRDRDVDICFIGSRSPRRLEILSSYSGSLSRWRCHLLLSDNSQPNATPSPDYLAGAEKLELLRRSKVVLNVHAHARPYFETLRVNEAILSGAAVVSEHAPLPPWLTPGEHLLTGRASTLALLAQELLEHPERRRALTEAAFERVRDTVLLSAAALRMVAAAQRVDAQARSPNSVGRAIVPPVRGAASPIKTATTAREDPEAAARRRALKQVRLDLLDTRRLVTRLRRALALESSREVQIARRSPSHRAAHPRVSVLVSVYNDGHAALAALDSVLASRHDDLELVIVDDGSTDDSRHVVGGWVDAHPQLPCLHLAHAVNRGLPWTRNTALDFARGESVFILDADNTVYPHALARLEHALRADAGASFAYGLIERFASSGYSTLSGVGAWEPARLRTSNYIDAMAMIRAPALRDLGGFCTETTLYGWEDYDLWCAMAESGRRGVAVPEVLARYRAGPQGMAASLTDVSHDDAYARLIERHPRLMAGVIAPCEG